ncbi:IgGFc-binding protein-like [Mizuhopecten yessoensis]|uniref:IgGFc-binding protein n=1 Tax=Mizuhopecten yessoensis TaxID=6573 RepID=A0A210Q4G1_MIZYE|nr:IgGFc-binding protein-like [Mizuhopecten yessoensis]OWF43617.1 IgGFc-binding protein [Mizuhopecten yessoensis]
MDGFPKQRGPVCLDCPQSRYPADCDAISVCQQDEVCYVEETFKLGDIFYRTSCLPNTDKRCVPPTYNPVEVGKRSDQRGTCFFCCPYDLCNTKCHPSSSSLLTTLPSTTPAPETHDFKGKTFFLMFMRNFEYGYLLQKLSVDVTLMATNAHIEVITRYNSTSKHLSGPAKHIEIDANMTMRENGKTGKGVILTSNTSMSATAFNFYQTGSGDGYRALPIEHLGDSYIVGTFRPNDKHSYERYGTSFAVGAPFVNTVVNITLSTSGVSVPGQYHREGDTITVVLDKLDTFYIETTTSIQDLTGTRIVSNKPVAVISGNVCSHEEGCNHLNEYLPPVSKWGSRFIVPPIMRSTSGIIRIVPSVNSTSVIVNSNTLNKTYTISTFIDIDTDPTQPYSISSDEHVLVLLFFNEIKVGMSVVPSINQFSNEPVLVTPPIFFYHGNTPSDNYIVVSIRTSDQSGLQIRSTNGTDLTRVGSVTFPGVDGEMFSFISVNYKQTCSVQHRENNVAFSVITYGFRSYETYAYPANLCL